MYYRNFRPAEKRNENNIPVQYFGDSFSADAFTKQDKKEVAKEEKQECSTCEKQEICEKHNEKTTAKNPLASLDIENLLLIGLILLFLTDCECKEDIIIPVILGIILLT